jgi:hypothetical protein
MMPEILQTVCGRAAISRMPFIQLSRSALSVDRTSMLPQ